MSTELKRIQKTFPKVHKRKGRTVGHNIKIECCAKCEFKRQRGDKQRVNARGRQATNKSATVLQSLGSYTFASQWCSDEVLQKVIGLIRKPDSTKTNRLPTPWREKFRCPSSDEHRFMYMAESLVIPKLLHSLIMRSLHYGRDRMLATISNVCWPQLHREIVAIAKN